MEPRHSFRQQKNYDMLPDGRVRVYYDERKVETTEQVEGGEPIPVIDYTYLVADADSYDRNAIIVALIRTRYSADDELAVQRQRDEKPVEYTKYNGFVEWCKAYANRVFWGDTLETAQGIKIGELKMYDGSEAVNEFTIGNKATWLSPASRSNYLLTIQAAQTAGVETVVFEGVTIPVANALAALHTINIYAMQCVAVTNAHEAAINALETIEAVEAYDFTVGYPEEKPSF